MTKPKIMRCPRCFLSTNYDTCRKCGKPTVPVRDLHAKIQQETLE